MRSEVNRDALLIGEVSEVHGTKVKIKVYNQANEMSVFFHGKLVRGVSVGGYLRIPCGYDDVIGVVEGDYQQERRLGIDSDEAHREAPGAYLDRFVDVSVFGSFSMGRFSRGVEVLPLVRSKAYLLPPDELMEINSPTEHLRTNFRIGALAGHDDIDVRLPLNALFASHIGIFGNTGSGKSNTLCRLFTDCFERGVKNDKSEFVFIDFNGEYTEKSVLISDKLVYRMSTREDGDKIPVPSDFFFDVDIWAMLSMATERTQRPFLKRCIDKAKKISKVENPDAYLHKMVEGLLEGYCGNAPSFDEQREDLSKLLCLAPDVDREKVDEVLDSIEVFSGSDPSVLRLRNLSAYLNKPSDMPKVFGKLEIENVDYSSIVKNAPLLLKFIARYRFIEWTRSGVVTREHIAPLVRRYISALDEASKLYEPAPDSLLMDGKGVVVVSLRDVNLEQKKNVPLVIARVLYQMQKVRGQADLLSSAHLIIDEAHNILSYSSQRESESWRDYRLETFEEIVKEGRKFGMYLTVCSQRPADISPAILSQMHNYFIHRLVNDEDLRAISKAVSFIDGASASMIPVLPQGCCIISGTATPYPMRVQVDPLERERQPMSYDRDLAAAWGWSDSWEKQSAS